MKSIRRILSLAVIAVLFSLCSIPVNAASVSQFTDVAFSAWYYRAVDYAASEGLFAGTGSNTFSPDLGMTRGMFVTVLGRKSGIEKRQYTTSTFSDVDPKSWYGPYVEWAAKYGIVSGTGNGKFDPNRQITREQMAKILYGYAQITGNDTTVNDSRYNQFPDIGRVSGYAVQSMKWAVTHGILKGTDGKLDPQGTATRAQVAQVFLNARDVLIENEILDKSEDDQESEQSGVYVSLSAEQRAMLTADQDPDEVVRQILVGTEANWDGNLTEADGYYMDIMFFGFTPNEMYTTSHAVFNTLEYLNDTGADRFRIVTFNDPSYILEGQPANGLQVIYTIPKKTDSAIMARARKIVEDRFRNATFTPDTIKTGCGWRGRLLADDELTAAENAERVALREIHYLDEWYDVNRTFNYWISEPTPGVYYFFY